NLDIRAANIFKQECLSVGADLALPKDACKLIAKRTDAALIANLKQIEKLIVKLNIQPFGLKEIAKELQTVLKNYDRKIEKPKIMGVLNVTPDSFSDGGKFLNPDNPDKAVAHAMKMIKEGADIIDIGGESTGPGSKNVSIKEELERVIPVIKAIRKKDGEIAISIDTYKAKVAEEALKAGANMINDVTAMRSDSKMVDLVKKTGVPVCLMYSKDSTARTTKKNVKYDDVIQHIGRFLQKRIFLAENKGVKPEQIIIDPGMGVFVSGDPKYSFEILARLGEFKSLGYPILIGPSRKSFLGGKMRDRREGTLAASLVAMMNGASIIRVHDVKGVKKLTKFAC
ncbi:dihydropteroate synthase, partial [Patescibacteria group bacterium]|nr:dihydropteroate synthase [Patescibacteria group bacterium]